MNLIVAVSNDWGIGYKNDLLFRIREDLQRFRALTINKVVVMGHNTFKSLPGGKPLPGRTNIVLSKKIAKIPDTMTCNSISALETELKKYDLQDVFDIGGEKIYTQLLNYCRTAYITKVDANPNADAFMPNIDKLPNWRLFEETLPRKQGEFSYKYSIYTNGLFIS